MDRLHFACALAGAIVLGAACYVGPVDDASPSTPGGGHAADGGSPASPGEGGAEASGLPCDVHGLVASKCASCHGTPLAAPMRLVTYDDLTAPAPSDPARKVAEVMVARMRSATSPMPPSPGAAATPAEIGAVEKWIAAGYPRGACGASSSSGDAGGAAITSVCTSGVFWSSGKRGVEMHPGRACIQCHTTQSDEGPIVQIGGTVFPTFREPDECFGVDGTSANVHVVITDAKGSVFDLPVAKTGNFALTTGATFPIRAKVVAGGKERAMSASQTSGDCNACHTESGANGAPGRITAP